LRAKKGDGKRVWFGGGVRKQHMLVGKMAGQNIQQLLQALLSTDNDTRSKAEVRKCSRGICEPHLSDENLS
jgi:hypothetical protein